MNAALKNKLLWALQIVIGAYFLVLAGLNFVGIAPMVMQFDTIGIGQWFRYATGLCQLLGGAALLTPKFSGYGAVLLVCLMIGAIVVRIAVLSSNPFTPIILLLINGFIASQRLKK